MFVILIIAIALLAVQANAIVIKITAESNATDFWFTPNVVAPSVNDVLEFHFLPKNHSVALGDFDRPCRPAARNAFFSGFNFATTSGEAPKIFRITITHTNPLVWYCTQADHCVKGMAGVANPAGDRNLVQYQSDAKVANVVPAQAPPQVGGGLILSNPSVTATSVTSTTSQTTRVPTSSTTAKSGATHVEPSFMAGALAGVVAVAAMLT